MLNKNTTPDTALFRPRACDHMHKTPDSAYLIIVVMTMKERFLSEDHAGEHATQTPHIQAVVIHLQMKKRDVRSLTSFTTVSNKTFFMHYPIFTNPCKTGSTRQEEESSIVPGSLPAVQVL